MCLGSSVCVWGVCMLLGGLVCLGVSSCIWGSVCIWGIGMCWGLYVSICGGSECVWESYVCLGGSVCILGCIFWGLLYAGYMCLGVVHVSGHPCVLGTCGFSRALYVFRESPYPHLSI